MVGADNKLSLKAVTVVKYRENAAIIKGPLQAGDVIVAAGVHKLREGQVVKPTVDPYVTGDGKVAIGGREIDSRAQHKHRIRGGTVSIN